MDEHVVAVDPERAGEGVQHPLGHHIGVVGAALEEQGEFIAADSGGGVAGTNALGDALPCLDEEIVGGGVAQAVVDEFEVIEVDGDHGHRTVVTCPQRHRVGQSIGEQGAVGQPGEGVTQRLLGRRRQQPPVLPGRDDLAGTDRDHDGGHEEPLEAGHHQRRADGAGQQERDVGQPQRRRRGQRHHGAWLVGLSAQYGRRRERRQRRRPEHVDQIACAVALTGGEVCEGAVGDGHERDGKREHGQHDALTSVGAYQHDDGDGQGDHVEHRIEKCDRKRGPVFPVGDEHAVQREHPRQQEQTQRHGDRVEQQAEPSLVGGCGDQLGEGGDQ